MPIFRLETNVAKSQIPSDFLTKTTALLAKTLGKPEGYCVVIVIPDLQMVWGGTSDPCGTARLLSIGKLGVKENKKHAAAFYDHIEKTLGIPKNRFYIQFVDEDPANVGYDGTTFHEIFGGS